MLEYELAREHLLISFLTEISEDTEPSYVETLAKKFLLRKYSSEWVDRFWENLGDAVESDLVEEYNSRITEGFQVHFTFIDDEGKKIRGYANPTVCYKTSIFQKALLTLTDDEFEGLSARVLQFAGCASAWVTPKSHDQGLDAFGCFPLFNLRRIPEHTDHFRTWILVQAKHYNKEKVSSSDIRELVGSGILMKYNIYESEGKRYSQLNLQPFAPIAFVLVTSGEVKRTARTMADKSGIFLMTSSDLCAVFSTQWQASGTGAPASFDEIVIKLREEAAKVPKTQRAA